MIYAVQFRPAVLKAMKRFPGKDLVRIKKKIETLAAELPPPHTTKLKGDNPFHRVRCGNYRIIYEIHEQHLVVLVVRVGHRRDVYARLT
jgi:mRNA interferase RelE/StbE